MNQHLELTIEPWERSHPKWEKLLHIIDSMGQADWFSLHADFHHSNHILVALVNGEVVGFLRFTVQYIGPDRDLPLIEFQGVALNEAKILAFGVIDQFKRHGIGEALQKRAIAWAKTLGCYQVRSHSGGDSPANHQLKLSLGFAVHPTLKDDDDPHGVFFIKTL
jgi:GNAT superfamily N-acetyltransferase